MATYEFEAPNGKRYRVEANTPETAQAGFAHMVATSPMLFQKPGVALALKDEQKLNPYRKGQLGQRMADAASLGLSTQFNAAIPAAVTGMRNLVGMGPGYTAKDAYDASRLNSAALREKGSADHPVLSVGSDVLGALTMPGSEQVGKFIIGKAAPKAIAAGKNITTAMRAAQLARTSGVGALEIGAQSAAQAKPGEEVEQAKTGALTGAVMAPVVGTALAGAVKAAPAVVRAAKRMVGQGPSVETTATEKIVKALRKEGLTPDMVRSVAQEWDATGGVSPNTIDLLKGAGASPAVFDLLRRSAGHAEGRIAAEDYGRSTVEGVQKKALDEVSKLQTGEPRTPAQIRADLAAKYGEVDAQTAERLAAVRRRGATKVATVDKRLERDLNDVDAQTAAASPEPPAAPVAREQGASQFADELNQRYDASKALYEDAYKQAEAAHPESAVIPDSERSGIITTLLSDLGHINPKLPGAKKVVSEIESLRQGQLPEPTEQEIAAGAQESPEGTRPLTVMDLHDTRALLQKLAGDFTSPAEQRYALIAKNGIDRELERLAGEGKIEGDDPEVVSHWVNAIQGFAKHKAEFGDGLAAKLTERVPGKPDERVIPSYRAADVIFGTSGKVRPLNTVLSELEPALKIASPEAKAALQGELYGRAKPEELAALRETTGGKALLPADLTDESLAAQKATQDAEAAAEAARVDLAQRSAQRRTGAELGAAEREKVAQREGEAQRSALETSEEAPLALGEKALTTPTEEFLPAVDETPSGSLPVLASGSKQAITDFLESPAPESTGRLRQLMGERASRNLEATLGTDEIAQLQARLRNMHTQAQTAQELEMAAGAGGAHESPLVESVGPYDVINPKRAGADMGLNILRRLGRLSPEEYQAALKLLTTSGESGMDAILPTLLKKYPTAHRAAAPALARPAMGKGDREAMDQLREQYGLDY